MNWGHTAASVPGPDLVLVFLWKYHIDLNIRRPFPTLFLKKYFLKMPNTFRRVLQGKFPWDAIRESWNTSITTDCSSSCQSHTHSLLSDSWIFWLRVWAPHQWFFGVWQMMRSVKTQGDALDSFLLIKHLFPPKCVTQAVKTAVG